MSSCLKKASRCLAFPNPQITTFLSDQSCVWSSSIAYNMMYLLQDDEVPTENNCL